MTPEEGKQRLRDAGVEGYFEPEDQHNGSFLLDGWYSLEDLEAIVSVIRALRGNPGATP